jgi:hypothetical protein
MKTPPNFRKLNTCTECDYSIWKKKEDMQYCKKYKIFLQDLIPNSKTCGSYHWEYFNYPFVCDDFKEDKPLFIGIP